MVPQFAYAGSRHLLEDGIMATRYAADRPRAWTFAGRVGSVTALVLAAALTVLIYRELDPVTASRTAFAACAGHAAAALHAPDASDRQQAVDTLVECAAAR
jgi:hypothetical protein